jgi:hypothetical protein
VNASSSLAMLGGAAIAATGIVGLISPQTYVQLGWYWAQPPGVYVVALVQFVIGLCSSAQLRRREARSGSARLERSRSPKPY